MTRPSLSLQALLTSLFGLFGLALALSVSAVAERVAAEHLRTQIGYELATYADSLRDRLDGVMHDHWQLVRTLATVSRDVAPTRETWRAWIDSVQAAHKDVAWLGLTDADGIVVTSSGGLLQGKSVAQRPWYRAARGGPFAGDVHEAVLLAQHLPPLPDGEPMRFVDVATPIHGADGRLLGVLGGHLSWAWARRVERSILAPLDDRRSGIEGLILRSDGEVLLGSASLIGTKLDPALIKQLEAASHNSKSRHALVDWDGGRPYLVSTSKSVGKDDFPGLDWTVVVRQPIEAAFAPVSELGRTILLSSLALVIPFGLMGFGIAKVTTRPLLALVSFAEHHRSGDRDRTVPSGGYSEAKSLSFALGRLLSDLTARDAALEASNRVLEQRVEERTRALQKASALTKRIVGSSPDVILVADPGGQIEFASRPAHWLPDDPDVADLIGRAILSLFPAGSRGALEAAMRNACEVPSAEIDVFCPSETGDGKWLSVLSNVMHDEQNQFERLLCIVRDRTEDYRQAEAQRLITQDAQRLRTEAVQASKAKSEFLASMSHEIRTPLNAVIGFTGIILDRRDLPTDLTRQIKMIQTSGNALLTVVNDVLDFSKIEAGGIALEPRPFSIRTLAENALSIVEASAAEKQLALALDLDPTISPWLVGDEDRLRQIMLNLINNAVKFTREGSVTLRLSALQRSAEREQIAFAVTDTGIGIPPDKIDRLFKRFSQVDGSIRREFGGTGLGLAICQQLVGLMGGEISVASEPWKGSTFSFTLWLGVAEAAGPAASADDALLPAPVRPRRVLLAEDVAANQEIARVILESAGHQVVVVDDGAAAVKAVEAGTYDAVLMDIQMPIMDGLTATARIRELKTSASRIPIIALTANVLSEQVEVLRTAGMNDHVGKPFRRVDLLRAIERCCRGEPDSHGSCGEREPVSQAAVLDRSVLDELVQLAGPAQVVTWLGSVGAQIEAIYPSDLAVADLTDAFLALNHTLIAQAGMLGFKALSDACRTLETVHRAHGDLGSPLQACQGEARHALEACATASSALDERADRHRRAG